MLINGIFDYLEEFIAENEETNDVNVRSLVFASKLGLKKLSLYYQKTDQTYIFACSTMLDCSLKFNYWRDEDWEARVILDQENTCVKSFKSFLYYYFSKQQSFSAVDESAATESLPTAATSSTTAVTSSTATTSTTATTSSTAATSSTATNLSTATTLSATPLSAAIASSTATRSFGVSYKRKIKLKNKTLSEMNKKQRSADATIQELVDIHLSELNTYVSNDDTSLFPVEELIFESYAVNDNILVPDENEYLNENGFGNEQASSTSEILSLNSKYFKNQKVLKSQLQNGLAFAQQSLNFWKHFQLKYPTLSLFALKLLSIPATSVASERLFSTAKRIINNNRANLSVATAESAVLLSCWKKEMNELH